MMQQKLGIGRPKGGKISKMEAPPPWIDCHPDKWKHMDAEERNAAVVKARNKRRENRRKGIPAQGVILPEPVEFEEDPPRGQVSDAPPAPPPTISKENPSASFFPIVEGVSSLDAYDQNDTALVNNAYRLAAEAPGSNDPFRQAVYVTLLRGAMKRGGRSGILTPAEARERVSKLLELRNKIANATDAEFTVVAEGM